MFIKYLILQDLSADTENYRTSIDEHNKVFYEMKKRKDQLQSERKYVCSIQSNLLVFELIEEVDFFLPH